VNVPKRITTIFWHSSLTFCKLLFLEVIIEHCILSGLFKDQSLQEFIGYYYKNRSKSQRGDITAAESVVAGIWDIIGIIANISTHYFLTLKLSTHCNPPKNRHN
jgi:hypothetical protein